MGSMGQSTPLKNIILVGPGGSIGSVLLSGLLSEPSLSVSVLVRESSKSLPSLPTARLHKIFQIADSLPYEKILEAFRGQDAVVNATTSTLEQFRFIDAAIEAGVKRYVPSEGRYGSTSSPRSRQGLRGILLGVGCGLVGNINPDKTKNVVVYISDFATTQVELVEAIERISGEKWTLKTIESYNAIEENKKQVAEGDHFAVYRLVSLGAVTGRYGGWLEEKEKIWNEELGLPKEEFEDVVTRGLERMKG